MRRRVLTIGLALATVTGLAGCQPKNTAAMADDSLFEWASPHKAGRYGGLGVYPAGERWSKIALAEQPKDAAAARTTDDEHVIVVVDSKTGEIRQCGDLSGYCIGMNPWAKPLAPGRVAPIALTAHADAQGQSSHGVALTEPAAAK